MSKLISLRPAIFAGAIGTIIFWIVLGLFNVFVGGWSVMYLASIIGVSFMLPFIVAAAIGLFVAEITVPLAIVVIVIKAVFGL